ncbi:MAG: GIY-YIG nuclease family protein, partial [Bacteroidetes bacterium]|nr:GIY-YIG nuclease family protein [Bacteroidota bacterium]
MYKVYILYSRLYDKTYVGFSSDVDQRLISHNHPQNKGYTKRFQPWEI